MQNFVVFFSVAGAIFLAELGDKTQLFIMSLASKEKPIKVLVGMAISIILLNVMAVYLGVALSAFISPELVGLISGFAFLIFAYLSLSDEGEGIERKRAGKYVILSIAVMFFMAELGDKTQLSVIALSAKAPENRIAIFGGAILGMILADGIGVILGAKVGKRIPQKAFSIAAFILFSLFGTVSVGESIDLLLPGKAVIPTVVIMIIYLAIVFAGRRKA